MGDWRGPFERAIENASGSRAATLGGVEITGAIMNENSEQINRIKGAMQ